MYLDEHEFLNKETAQEIEVVEENIIMEAPVQPEVEKG